MKKKTIKILLTLISAIVLYLLLTTTSQAALSISTSKSTVSPGESFSVTVSVSSNEAGAINLSVSNGRLSSSYVDLMSQSSVTISCTAGNSGTVSISASGKVANYNTETEGQQSASKTVQIVTPVTPVNPSNGGNSSSNNNNNSRPNTNNNSNSNNNNNKPETQKSNDSTLKSLTIEGCELYPEFSPETKEYSVKVGNDVTSVNIVATANDSKASCKLEGVYQDLAIGENTATVVVTAEDGSTNRYIIKITRGREALKLVTLKISYKDSEGNIKELKLNPELSEEIFEYKLEDLSYLISKLDVEVIANLEDAKIEITGNEKLSEGENIITITITMPAESEELEDEVLTYKIVVNKEKEPVVTPIGKIKNWFKGITGTISTWVNENLYGIVVGSLMLCSACMGGITVYLVIEYKKYRLLMQKIAEITRMNNTNSVPVSQTINSLNIQNSENENLKGNNKSEEIENKEEETQKNRGKHF